jgi:hypothetical protein
MNEHLFGEKIWNSKNADAKTIKYIYNLRYCLRKYITSEIKTPAKRLTPHIDEIGHGILQT